MPRQTYASAIQRIDYPVHRGVPNPAHGKFLIVGSIPMDCYDEDRNDGAGGSTLYDTEDDAIDALVLAGSEFVQRCNGSRVDVKARLQALQVAT